MSRFAISESAPPRPPLRAGAISWRLAQTFWVGGLWLLYFVLLPALEHYGLAPLLLEDISASLIPLLLGFAGFCVLFRSWCSCNCAVCAACGRIFAVSCC
ncbi:hypothetical protein D3C86_1343240 [compost metagenome]